MKLTGFTLAFPTLRTAVAMISIHPPETSRSR